MEKRLIKGIIRLLAPPTLVASFVPMTVTTVYCFVNIVDINLEGLLWVVLMFVAMTFIEIGKHAVNDYYDYKSGADLGIDQEHKNEFSGGKKTLTEGLIDNKEIIIIGVISFFIAILMGLFMTLYKTFLILPVGIIGILISICYTMPPFKLVYRGLGEVAIFIVFGILINVGTSLFIGESINMVIIIYACHLGFLITNVLVINEFPDYEGDLRANKRNLVVIFGKEKACKIYLGLFISAYLFIVAIIIITGELSWGLALLTIPLAKKSYSNCKKNYNDIKKLLYSNLMTARIYVINGILLIVGILINTYT